jgi:hypothetical protein
MIAFIAFVMLRIRRSSPVIVPGGRNVRDQHQDEPMQPVNFTGSDRCIHVGSWHLTASSRFHPTALSHLFRVVFGLKPGGDLDLHNKHNHAPITSLSRRNSRQSFNPASADIFKSPGLIHRSGLITVHDQRYRHETFRLHIAVASMFLADSSANGAIRGSSAGVARAVRRLLFANERKKKCAMKLPISGVFARKYTHDHGQLTCPFKTYRVMPSCGEKERSGSFGRDGVLDAYLEGRVPTRIRFEP